MLFRSRLRDVALANPGRTYKQHVALLPHELAGGQLVDLAPVDRGIEGEVEVFQGTRLPEVCHLVAAHDLSLVAHIEFVLDDQFKELGIRQPVGFSFLETQLQTAKQPGQAQLQGVAF